MRLWDVAMGKERSVFPVPNGGAWSVAFSPDGKTLASGHCHFGSIRLWEIATGRVWKTFCTPGARILTLAFSPDGKRLTSGSFGNAARLFDTMARPSPATLHGHKGSVRCVAFSPDGKTLASGSDDGTVSCGTRSLGRNRAHCRGRAARLGPWPSLQTEKCRHRKSKPFRAACGIWRRVRSWKHSGGTLGRFMASRFPAMARRWPQRPSMGRGEYGM